MSRSIESRVSRLLVVAALCALPAQGMAAMAGANTVNSAAIVDGAVATSDIASSAVTTAKIANGAVTAAKLGIVCSAGQILQYASTGWVCSAGTPGPVGPQGTQGPAGATGATGQQGPAGISPHYARVVVVAKSGGDFTDPVAALNSITDASATNPYLVKIMPGVYDLGANSLKMLSYVDVEGAGVNVTTITGAGAAAGYYYATIVGAANSELRSLTAENNSAYFVASVAVIYNEGTAFKVTDVKVNPFSMAATSLGLVNTGGSETASLSNVVINNGNGMYGAIPLINDNAKINMDRVNITKAGCQQGPGLENIGTSYMTISNSSISVSGGCWYNDGFWNHGTIKLNNTSIVVAGGSSQLMYNQTGGAVYVSNSEINVAGAVTSNGGGSFFFNNSKVEGVFSGGAVKCIGVFNENYDPITCQ